MNTIKTLTIFSAVLLMGASIKTAYAEDGDMTQTQTRDLIQTHQNLQTPNADDAQSLNTERNRVMNKKQNQYQYDYENQASAEQEGKGNDSTTSGVMNRYNNMNRNNTMNRYSQNSAISDSMNRQSTTTRSMGGRR